LSKNFERGMARSGFSPEDGLPRDGEDTFEETTL